MTAMSGAYAQRFLVTLFLVSFGTYLFLATVTYTPFDPGWMHVSSDTQYVSNASGVAGAWIADLLFGFLGWAAILIPLFLFIEAIQVWWPRSFLNRPFRYVAQFFILIVSSSLLFLCWNVPADTLDNASGGIIGYEIGRSLESLLTIYGAVFFLFSFLILLCTFAYGIRWDKTWETLQNIPSYLQDLFYRNQQLDLEEKKILQKAQSLTAVPTVNTAENVTERHDETKSQALNTTQGLDQDLAEFDKWQQQLAKVKATRSTPPVAVPVSEPIENIDDEIFEQTIEKAHQLTQDTQRVVSTGEVWRAVELSQHDPRQDIDALLKAADEPQPHVVPKLKISDLHAQNEIVEQSTDVQTQQSAQHIHSQSPTKTELDWDDDIDALLAVVPHQERHQPVEMDQPIETQNTQQSSIRTESQLRQESEFKSVSQPLYADQLDDIFDDLEAEFAADVSPRKEPSSVDLVNTTAAENDLAHSLHALAENVNRDEYSDTKVQQQPTFDTAVSPSVSSTQAPLTKDAFVEAWQETAGKPIEEDDFDFDAPLTDSAGRPLSRAMQVAERRKDLSPLPGLELLDKVDPNKKVNFTAEQLERLSELLEIKLQEFNVKAKVVEAQPGPVVTRFELDLAPGVKASKVTNISRDLARSMSMASVRVVEVIPGKPYIGIEVPNSTREMVRLIELVQIPKFNDPDGILSMAMGKDISGNPVITELGKAPHMLVAGTTGSGKSVAVNSMILSMLLKYTPDQLRLILIDPKQLELANYNDIPHLLTPVVTDMKDAVSALNWCVNEMERRYKLMSFLKIRKLADYNRKVEEAIANGEELFDPTWKASDSVAGERPPRLTPLPSIVIVADEFADMIMQVGKKAEEMITRLAQKSRAAGIHLLLATQRPSVDVITGLIKANIPTRVALRVNSKIDSRTILDAGGAEDLLGHGDMLFLGPGKIEPERVHGAFISDDEVNRICDAWRERGSPNYVDEILTPFDEDSTSKGFEDGGEGGSDRDPLYDQCVAFVLETRKASTSSLQRKFSLGYNRAARIIDQMEEHGIVSSMGANGKREILV